MKRKPSSNTSSDTSSDTSSALHPESFIRSMLEGAPRHGLKPTDLLAFVALWTHTNSSPERRAVAPWAHAAVFPTDATVADLSGGKSARWVRDVSMKALEAAGYVWTVRPQRPVQLGAGFGWFEVTRNKPLRLLPSMCSAEALRAFVAFFGVESIRGACVELHASAANATEDASPPRRAPRSAVG